MGLRRAEQVLGQRDGLRVVSKGISELLDHDSVKGFLEAATSMHCQQASRTWQHCLGVSAQGGDTLLWCFRVQSDAQLCCTQIEVSKEYKGQILCFMH